MNQISKGTDAKLHSLSAKITKAEEQIEEATATKNESWKEVSDIFDELGWVGPDMRFIAEDGHTLYISKREGTPTLDVNKLQAVLFQKLPDAEAKKIWNKITSRTVNTSLLEEAVRRQLIPAEIVEECMTPAKTSFARMRPEWSKEDKERARILGIQVNLPA